MPVFVREPRQPSESDDAFQKRDEEHWRRVAEAEALLLRQRQQLRTKPPKRRI